MYTVGRDLKKRSGEYNGDVVLTCHQYKVPDGGSPILWATVTRTGTVDRKSFTGWDIPDFHKRMKRGDLIPHTPWTRTVIYGTSSGDYDWTSPDNIRYYYVDDYPNFSDWIVTEEDLAYYAPITYDQYVTEAAARIYSKGFDALTFVAELKDVKKQFTNVGKFLTGAKLPVNWRLLTSEYLSFRYGWRPLLHDLISLNEAIKALNEARLRYSERAGTKFSTTFYESATTEWSAFFVDRVTTTKVTTSIRGSVVADIEIPAFQFNPLQTGWEVIPFSFVIDWFVNVGSTLSAYSFLARQKNYAASAGYRIDVERSFNAYKGDSKAAYESGIGYSQSGNCQASLEFRRPCPIPLTPQITVKMNPWKVLDLMALILQRI